MVYLVAYDIKDNNTRTRLARFLGTKGIRLQKSLFAVEIERRQFKKLLADIRKIADKTDLVAVFRLCKGCQEKAVQLYDDRPDFYLF